MPWPSITPGDLIRITTLCWFDGQLGCTVTHWVTSGITPPAPDLSDIGLAMEPTLGPGFVGAMSSAANWYGLKAQIALPGTSAEFQALAIAPVPGSRGPNPLPYQVSGIITLRSGLVGQRNRGRMYIPFPAEADAHTPEARPLPAYVAQLQALAATLAGPHAIVGIGGGSVTLDQAILHRDTGTAVPVIQWDSRNRFATQRRRGNYGAFNPEPS